MPLYRVEVTKVLVANVFIDAEDDEEAAIIALQELPEEDQFETEDINCAGVEEVDPDVDGLNIFVHNDDRSRTVRDWLDDVEGDYE
jgi:hypothetical protein